MCLLKISSISNSFLSYSSDAEHGALFRRAAVWYWWISWFSIIKWWLWDELYSTTTCRRLKMSCESSHKSHKCGKIAVPQLGPRPFPVRVCSKTRLILKGMKQKHQDFIPKRGHEHRNPTSTSITFRCSKGFPGGTPAEPDFAIRCVCSHVRCLSLHTKW